MMPEMGSTKWEKMVDYMRADLESGMAYTKIEMAARKMFKEQGRDFDSEFNEFLKKKRKEDNGG